MILQDFIKAWTGYETKDKAVFEPNIEIVLKRPNLSFIIKEGGGRSGESVEELEEEGRRIRESREERR